MYWLTNTSFIVPYDNEMELAKKFQVNKLWLRNIHVCTCCISITAALPALNLIGPASLQFEIYLQNKIDTHYGK